MADVDNKIKMIVEGLLLAAGKPLSLSVIASVFTEDEQPDNAELKEVLEAIADDCNDRGFELKQVASGYRFQVKQDISEWIARLWEERPPRYSRALLETLALIAYRQPITRGDVEEIRGVAVSSNIIRTLVDREWVRIVGHKDVPGKPALYATTRQFLDYFNLKSIQELPPLSEVRELTQASEEFDVEDDLSDRNVLELPEEGEDGPPEVVDEEGEPVIFDADELPDEDEAVALSHKPLDEILGLQTEEELEDPEQVSQDSDSEQDSLEADSGTGSENTADVSELQQVDSEPDPQLEEQTEQQAEQQQEGPVEHPLEEQSGQQPDSQQELQPDQQQEDSVADQQSADNERESQEERASDPAQEPEPEQVEEEEEHLTVERTSESSSR
ncbi:MAG: SMC-Scp complex subunit ScpB [Gammaproteobacteria bacterium]|nr:SMC-Scp complex subunit ScpB [Gammaproteobacteria bacterium]